MHILPGVNQRCCCLVLSLQLTLIFTGFEARMVSRELLPQTRGEGIMSEYVVAVNDEDGSHILIEPAVVVSKIDGEFLRILFHTAERMADNVIEEDRIVAPTVQLRQQLILEALNTHRAFATTMSGEFYQRLILYLDILINGLDVPGDDSK